MGGLRVKQVLASTALALVLTIPAVAMAAGTEENKGVAATADPAEHADPATAPAGSLSESEIEARIPMPESADVRPPTAADVGGLTTGSTEKAAASGVAKPAAAASATSTTSIETSAASAPAVVAPPVAAPSKDQAQPAAAPSGKDPTPVAGSLAAADVPIAEKLRDLVSGRLDRLVDRKKERAAVEAFYTARGFAPLWIENGAPNARAKTVIDRLKAADLDGLDARDYPTPDFAAVAGQTDGIADAELKLTATVLTFARHASSGRFSAARITQNVDVPQPALEPAEVLAKLADGKDPAKTLDGFDPPQPGFQLLKAKLAQFIRHDGADDGKHIEDGPTLKVGMRDPRVPAVRDRLGVEGDAANTTYDAVLAEAVKKFQIRMEMRGTGILDARTVAALNGPPRGRQVDAIIATMERWRWMPRDLGRAYVMVNLPDFTLKMVDDGKILFRTRIVIGKPAMPTPIFSNAIENIVVNPTWHVPESIVYREYLPALEQDPTVLARMGLTVSRDRSGRVVITQPPSERNALGRMKFNFPNQFNVYLHDTPDKSLFALERRAFSHGCMRVQNPTEFGEALLSVGLPEGHYTADRLRRMFGAGEEWLKFKTLIPVHITYQTAYVDDSDKLVVRDDLYGLDSRVLGAIKSTDLRIAEAAPAPEKRRDRPAAQRRRLARETVPPVQASGGSFFERLFR